jgi:hypothetical protein
LANHSGRVFTRPIVDVRDHARELDGQLARQDDAAVCRACREEGDASMVRELGSDLFYRLGIEDRCARG